MSGFATVEYDKEQKTGPGTAFREAPSQPAMQTGLFRGFGLRCPSFIAFSLPDGLYPNHRILFHQSKESPLRENEAVRTPSALSDDGARQSVAPSSMLLEAEATIGQSRVIFRSRDYPFSRKNPIKLLLVIH